MENLTPGEITQFNQKNIVTKGSFYKQTSGLIPESLSTVQRLERQVSLVPGRSLSWPLSARPEPLCH